MPNRKPVTSPPDEVMLKTSDLAERLAPVSPRTIEDWRARGEGPDYVRVGGRVMYKRSAVDLWLDAQTHRPAARRKRR